MRLGLWGFSVFAVMLVADAVWTSVISGWRPHRPPGFSGAAARLAAGAAFLGGVEVLARYLRRLRRRLLAVLDSCLRSDGSTRS